MLTLERLKEVLSYDPATGIFIRIKAVQKVRLGDKAGSLDKDGYVVIRIDTKIYKAHRLAWFYMTGEWPKNQIDHINMMKSDNSFINLREATNSENKMNVRLQKNSTSGYRGVCWNKFSGKWQAHIKLNGKKKHLGYFINIEDASAAFNKAISVYHGDFARSA